MGFKREELLYTLLWTCDILWRPTFRNLTDSFENWMYRSGFQDALYRMERQQFLERQCAHCGDRVYRLTEPGRVAALGGRDPEACWNRRWDGRWRLAVFDVPEARNHDRDQLRRCLRRCGLGCLQHSVWITPHPVKELRGLLAGTKVDAATLIFLEASPCAGETDADIVTSAWDFDEVDRRYATYGEVLASWPRDHLEGLSAARQWQAWLQAERKAWLEVMARDPLLPRCLLPSEYPGRAIWKERLAVMRQAGGQLRALRL